MKSLPKIITKIFLSIIIFCNLFFVGASFSYAADKNLSEKCAPGVDTCLKGSCIEDTSKEYRCLIFAPQVAIPGASYVQPDSTTAPIANYIKSFYNYAVGITAVVATVVLMIGGLQWIIAGGSGEKISEAKAWITAALTGLVLALSSYMILDLINPKLVNLKVTPIKIISKIDKSVADCCTAEGKMVATISTTDPKTKRVTLSCPTGATECDAFCVGKTEGTSCYTTGFCYKDRCLVGDGKFGEPCGGMLIGVCTETCLTNILIAAGAPYVAGIYAYGRSCGPDLWCCSWMSPI